MVITGCPLTTMCRSLLEAVRHSAPGRQAAWRGTACVQEDDVGAVAFVKDKCLFFPLRLVGYGLLEGFRD